MEKIKQQFMDLNRKTAMRLIPPKHNLDKLRDDYGHMQNMLFGNRPEFDEVLTGIENLEKKINNGCTQ